MNAEDNKPIKRTKKLEALLNRYDVSIRHSDSLVEHELSKNVTRVPPLEFAVFEAAIKAVFSSWIAADSEEFKASGQAVWYLHLATKNGFELPREIKTGPEASVAYASDYHYCVRLISDAGLYFALLD